MDFKALTKQLSTQAQAIASLCKDVSEEQARWKPDQNTWSILEVINHLYDEEREDFRQHLSDILLHPRSAWASIDPGGWVTERAYNEKNFQESLGKFLEEREISLRWLSSLFAPDWEQTYQTPFGPIRAGEMFAAWVAHDLLHMRQLVELHWLHTNQSIKPYSAAYAGEW